MTDLPDKNLLISSSTTDPQFQTGIGQFFDFVSQLAVGCAAESNVIATGVITPTKGIIAVDTEGSGATDDLVRISAATIGQKMIIVRSVSSARAVVLKHLGGGSGQLSLNGAADATLDHIGKMIAFYYDVATTKWIELWRNWGIYLPVAADLAAAKTALGLNTAAGYAVGTGAGQIPTNGDLGNLSVLDMITSSALLVDEVVTGAKVANNTLSLSHFLVSAPNATSLIHYNASGVLSALTPPAAPAASKVLKGDLTWGAAGGMELIQELSLSNAVEGVFSWTAGLYSQIFLHMYIPGSASGSTLAGANGIRFRLYFDGTEFAGTNYSQLAVNAAGGLVSRTTLWTMSNPPNTSHYRSFELSIPCCKGVTAAMLRATANQQGYYSPGSQNWILNPEEWTVYKAGELTGLRVIRNASAQNMPSGTIARLYGIRAV